MLKKLCAVRENAVPFACYMADLAQQHFHVAPPARLDLERIDEFRTRIDDAVACIHGYAASPGADADVALRTSLHALASAQSETRNMQWATVRTIDSRDALVIEKAAHCILDPRDAASWGYRLGSSYTERYDSRFGGGLVPESAPLVLDIAEFWGGAPSTRLVSDV